MMLWWCTQHESPSIYFQICFTWLCDFVLNKEREVCRQADSNRLGNMSCIYLEEQSLMVRSVEQQVMFKLGEQRGVGEIIFCFDCQDWQYFALYLINTWCFLWSFGISGFCKEGFKWKVHILQVNQLHTKIRRENYLLLYLKRRRRRQGQISRVLFSSACVWNKQFLTGRLQKLKSVREPVAKW